jgi:putative Mn2+ efflux pump MntP
MNLITYLLLSLALSMDTFAVSVASGSTFRGLHLRFAFRYALFFGFFQSIMLLAGWFAGLTITDYVNDYSHWLVFGLLTFIGLKMIYESTLMKKESGTSPSGFWILFGLAFATSIDALSVGISFSLLRLQILVPVLILGIVTFTAALTGIYLGERFGSLFEKKLVILGGIILILLGLSRIVSFF